MNTCCARSCIQNTQKVNVLVYTSIDKQTVVSSLLLCAPRCDDGLWCYWWSEFGRRHTNAEGPVFFLCGRYRLRLLKTHKGQVAHLHISPTCNSKWLPVYKSTEQFKEIQFIKLPTHCWRQACTSLIWLHNDWLSQIHKTVNGDWNTVCTSVAQISVLYST